MPFTNITPARIAGNFFYIRAGDRHLFTLGLTNVRVFAPGGRPFPATVNPQTGGTEPFLVHCPDLFQTSVPPLLPLRNGDIVHYQVNSNGVRITNVQRAGAANPPIPTSKSQIPGGHRTTNAQKSTAYRQGSHKTPESALLLSPVPQLPRYLEENRSRILSQPHQTLPRWDGSYDRYTHPVMKRLRKAFPSGQITRQDLIQLFTSWGDPVLGLVATMVWGMISTGGRSGDHLQSLLDMGEDVLKRKMEGLHFLLINGELERAFHQCSPGGFLKLDGVGYAFFTKLFCFIGQAHLTQDPAPLILDSRTSSAFFVLGAQAAPELPWEDLCNTAPLQANKPATWRVQPTPAIYWVFVTWFNQWAHELGCTALQLEQFVFGSSKKTQAGKCPSNPRTQLENLGKTLFPRG